MDRHRDTEEERAIRRRNLDEETKINHNAVWKILQKKRLNKCLTKKG